MYTWILICLTVAAVSFVLKLTYVFCTALVLPITRGALYVSTSRVRISAFMDAVPMQPGQLLIGSWLRRRASSSQGAKKIWCESAGIRAESPGLFEGQTPVPWLAKRRGERGQFLDSRPVGGRRCFLLSLSGCNEGFGSEAQSQSQARSCDCVIHLSFAWFHSSTGFATWQLLAQQSYLCVSVEQLISLIE